MRFVKVCYGRIMFRRSDTRPMIKRSILSALLGKVPMTFASGLESQCLQTNVALFSHFLDKSLSSNKGSPALTKNHRRIYVSSPILVTDKYLSTNIYRLREYQDYVQARGPASKSASLALPLRNHLFSALLHLRAEGHTLSWKPDCEAGHAILQV